MNNKEIKSRRYDSSTCDQYFMDQMTGPPSIQNGVLPRKKRDVSDVDNAVA